MSHTKNLTPEKPKSIKSLQALLHANIDLTAQFREAHWNVRNVANFVGLHSLFGEGYSVLAAHQDALAERIAQLGNLAEGNIRDAARESFLKGSMECTHDGKVLCTRLSGRAATYSKSLVNCFEAATETRDHTTANMLIGMSEAVDKLVWQIEANLE